MSTIAAQLTTSGEADIITSYVGGEYIPDREQGETNVYELDVHEGGYTPYVEPVLEEPVVEPIEELIITPENEQLERANTIIASDKYSENERSKYGTQLNTTFYKEFTPKGFAASEDELTVRKNNVLKSVKCVKKNSTIITTQKFIAD